MLNNNELYIKKCTEKDINDILNLQEDVIEHLEDKNVLRRNTKEMFLHCMKDPNLTVGVYHNDILIAISIFVDERGTSEDLSINIKKEPFDICANFKLVIVKNNYRGLHLQRNLMWILERYAYEKGYTKLCATVSPDNKYSLENIERSSYKFELEAIKYGGLKRYLYVKDIKSFNEMRNEILLKKLKEYEINNELIEFHLENYYIGEENILHTGDVIEFINKNNDVFYGIYFIEKNPYVCIFDNHNQKVIITDYCKEFNDYKINKYYISSFQD
ncbi:hypothetical protein BCR32DRAFT_293172 [Anaeromyces robustus]|uniref:N-acetyltransferase domain-containing protein n=1 Tax=Anaeromyces robustus TaxID=1754192 RepID=A0A1Y1X7B2_9FUNG|nr:hypothetical protein BCR32DRAFT_293172 [Anaeromyces robustus]|eukprot:ORX81660.1 hypothetical protein BCR32DRAFT_293172 [Anaeromyces robustus]